MRRPAKCGGRTAVHCRICSQLRPHNRANAVRACGDRAGVSVSIEPRRVPLIMRGTGRRAPCAPAMEPVSMRVVLCVPVISAVLIGAALSIGSSPVAAADCLTEPNRDAPPGQHWYYHLDHGADRKCWYLHATVPTGAAEPPAMELQSVRSQQRRQLAPARTATPAGDAGARSRPRRPPQRQRAAPQVPAPQNPALRSEADEAALYLEFLRWKEQNRGAP